MSELTSVLNGLGAAAKNPFAFVGYIIAVVSWAYLRARVERNKNLLQNLGKFPEAERGKKLSEEMGTAPLEGGLTPEQWIESKTHHYYFLAFVILCGVIVMLFAISVYENLHTPKVETTIVEPRVEVNMPDTMKVAIHDQVKIDPPDPSIAQMKALENDIDLGVQKDFVISALGQPRHSTSAANVDCVDYTFPFASVQLWFGKSKELLVMYVVAVSKAYHPNLVDKYRLAEYEPPGFRPCLGCFSFRDLTIEENMPAPTPDDLHPNLTPKPEYEGDPKVVHFNQGGSHAPFVYVETFGLPSSWRRSFYLIYTSDGVDDDLVQGSFSRLMQFMDAWDESKMQDFATFFDQLPVEQQKELNAIRGRFKPNAYALISDDVSDYDSEKVPVPRGGDDIDSVSCNGNP
jgi:hypothetical protein